ncbi:hypothetical protein OG205_08795 [Lentzea sp. NBC_00516]|uniref:hypothetical protein n=1 Tax=Lentzea sp. NBC_00516 TaxID=2903582 RepID=UPI002E817DD3|nr:hypothetical protein [Lentzea sp. NBC_00516]WUD27076.1 hypothetical protein OG205_08795 [Lentzea sp. NBC_00516]
MGEKLHESDRLVIAGQPLPEELAPRDHEAGEAVASLVRDYLTWGPDQQAEILALVRTLREYTPRTPPQLAPSVRFYAQTGEPGPVILRLLGNRNLTQATLARLLPAVTDGRRDWPSSSYSQVGMGTRELTPDLLGDLAALLDFSDADLGELTGIAPAPRPADVGDLVWECRRLSKFDIGRVREFAADWPRLVTLGENLHESDRLAIASRPMPHELLPLAPHASGSVDTLLRHFLPLSPEQRAEVLTLAKSLPSQDRTENASMPFLYTLCLNNAGPGGVVMRLLANRNLTPSAIAKMTYRVTNGGRYWSASTYIGVSTGRTKLTPELLGELAVLLNIPAVELEALTGITPVGTPDPEVGDLVWECRRLTGDQIWQLREFAESLG